MNAQTLILGTDEDSRDDISSNENRCKSIVCFVVMDSIENCEKDQTKSTNNCEEGRECRKQFLNPRGIVCETSLVPQPALGNEDNIKDNRSRCWTGNEQRFESCRSDIWDVWNVLVTAETRQMWFSLCQPDNQHCEECSWEVVSYNFQEWLNLNPYPSDLHKSISNQTKRLNLLAKQLDEIILRLKVKYHLPNQVHPANRGKIQYDNPNILPSFTSCF